MRTTVTLEPDVEQLLRRTMRERGISFKEAVNEAIRSGATQAKGSGVATDFPAFAMGEPLVDLTHALRLAGELEDTERARDHAEGA
jgi:hypothetical protein